MIEPLNIRDEEFLYIDKSSLDKMEFDIFLKNNGDLTLDDNKDILLSSGNQLKGQTARNIIKSITKNWFYDNIGADLEQLYGRPTNIAREQGLSLIENGFKKYDLFGSNEFYIKAIINNEYEILFIIIIQIEEEIIPIDVTLNITGRINIDWGGEV